MVYNSRIQNKVMFLRGLRGNEFAKGSISLKGAGRSPWPAAELEHALNQRHKVNTSESKFAAPSPTVNSEYCIGDRSSLLQ